MQVYDDQRKKTDNTQGAHDDLGVDPKQREAETKGLEDVYKAESAPENDNDTPADDKEKEKLDDQVGKGFTGNNPRQGPSLKKRLVIAGIATSVGGAVVGIIMFFLPILRLDSYMSRVTDRAYAASVNALEKRMSFLFERYMIRHLLEIERCGAVVSIDCRTASGSGMTSRLFNTWRDVRIEQKFFDKYGLSVESHGSPDLDQPRFTLRDRMGRSVVLTNADVRSGRFSGGSRVFGREINSFLKSETKWHQVMERRSVRKYLVRKHGVKFWCFFACSTRDDMELRRQHIATRFKYFLAKRFVSPFSDKLGTIFGCLTGGAASCTPERLRERGLSREVDNAFIDRIKEKMELGNTRFSQIVLEELVEKFLTKTSSQAAARTAIGAVPYAGQIYLGATVIDMLHRIDSAIEDNTLSRVSADINSRQYIEWYTGMRSLNDEMKTGELSMEETGAVMKEFEGAEESLVYQANYSDQSGGRVHRDPDYECPSGRPIAADELVCPEKTLQRTFLIEDIRNNTFVDGVATLLNRYDCATIEVRGTCVGVRPRSIVQPVLGGINWATDNTIGRALSAGLSVMRATPGLGSFVSTLEEKTGELVNAVLTKLFPLPIQPDSPGRDKYDGLEAGGAITAAEFNKGGYDEGGEPYGLGAPQLSAEQMTMLYEEYFEQQKYEYSNMGTLAKLTDVTYSGSFMNKVIDFVPTRSNNIPTTLAYAFPRMLGTVFRSFTTTKSVHAQAAAAQVAVNNAFGITMYGYPSGSSAFTQDPDLLTDEYCETSRRARQDSMTNNELSGFDEYTVADPCQLERVVAETGSSYYINEEEGASGL